jgi:lipid II:glycine glycyltransferase (peptidoglycan interpeptide bridge formation enzyme)
MQSMYDAGQGRFFFVTYERELLAANFVFTFGEKCWYIHGASSNERRNLMPTYLLRWAVMRRLESAG